MLRPHYLNYLGNLLIFLMFFDLILLLANFSYCLVFQLTNFGLNVFHHIFQIVSPLFLSRCPTSFLSYLISEKNKSIM